MDEVDNIIIHTFRQIGCDISSEIQSLQQFSTELTVEAVARCLRIIDDKITVSKSLPPGMSARFRVGTDLANACMSLGYKGEIGYQTFLYANEADIRKVLMFLIEKLPKDTSTTADEPLGKSALLNRAISQAIMAQLQSPWLPPHCKRRGYRWKNATSWTKEGCRGMHGFHSIHISIPQGMGDVTRKVPKDVKNYYASHLPVVSKQPGRKENLAASLMEANAVQLTAALELETEWNTAGLQSRLSQQEYQARKKERLKKKIAEHLRQGLSKAEGPSGTSQAADLMQVLNEFNEKGGSKQNKGSRFTHAEKLQFAQPEDQTVSQIGIGEGVPTADSEEELKRKKEEEAEVLRNKLTEITGKIEELDMDMKKFTAGMQQMEEQVSVHEHKNTEKVDAVRVKKRTLDLLPDAENNIAKLQGVVDASASRLVNLGNQWEKHRAPLIDEFRQLKELNTNRVSESQKKLEDIKSLREKMKELAEETRGKEDMLKQLAGEYERMAKDVNRSAYTRRILEIVSNIKRQKQDIDKILLDTKTLQKEINQYQGKLDRTFAATDELIFRDAKKDEAVRKAYKYLAALHESCGLLIKTVEETGSVAREIRDLEDQIDSESKNKTIANLEKISEDYVQMKKENQQLVAQLKGK
ncbi:coiled-coil domain-containing protein 22 homolog [Anneissia japonica]|uniref:coiled-coil domain-containing protein 22 homolog n=1 Tax=Anneissia japonica TaxID=1529436 RepID=UPI0014257570|nr:coiled-coil domain-containing protein 22 homolog [Anneissia japonica]